MKFFLSHIKKDSKQQVVGKKKLKVHIDNINTIVNKVFCTSDFVQSFQEFMKIVVKLHDLGKYTTYFQDYLVFDRKNESNLHHHAFIGACTAYNYFKEKNDKQAILAYVIIKQHHANLVKLDLLERNSENKHKIQIRKQTKDLLVSIAQIEQELEIPISDFLPTSPPDLFDELDDITNAKKDIQNYYLLNYLFSLLIEADKLDASDTQVYTRKALPINLVNQYNKIGQPQKVALPVVQMSQNELRNYVRASVLEQVRQPDILTQYLFTLTAPTGIGKTLTSLHFALELKAKIREKEQYEAQIIYGLPFINIIEQAIVVYDEVFEDKAKVLAHYQYADVLGSFAGNEDDEKNYNQKLMALDTWQADVVITSFVQFFQTLIGNRNKLLKKFHHYAGAIVILDEVQSLRLSQLPLVGAALYYLSKFMKTRVLMMTATKPKILDLANREILNKRGEKAEALELLPDYEEVFKAFNRTQIKPLIGETISTGNEFVSNIFSPHWQPTQSALIVCNMVNRSVELYRAMQQYLNDNNLTETVSLYYLSTNIVPAKRMDVIKQVKAEIESKDGKKKPVLISTQSIEAGVDLDFDLGFRDLAPIDSLIQVAGRINRNNHKDKQGAYLYIFKFKEEGKESDCSRIYDPITETQAEKALNKLSENGLKTIPEQAYLEMITTYFDAIADNELKSFEASRKFFESMETLNYDSGNYSKGGQEIETVNHKNKERDYSVSRFKIIENNQFAVSVFVEIDEEDKEVKHKFLQLIRQEISKEDFAPYKKTFHQRIISVPSYLEKVESLQHMIANGHQQYKITDNILCIPFNSLDEYYDTKTGFIRQVEDLQPTLSYSF